MTEELEQPPVLELFGTLATIDGYEVVATDTGHPVEYRKTERGAKSVAKYLNRCAANGRLAGAILRLSRTYDG